MPQTATPTAPVKHRACDECRTRKLACSKDPGGCGRCQKENIICHYSEQKPMGRPRKRQFIESTEAVTTSDADPLDLGLEPYIVDTTDVYKPSESVDAFFLNGISQPGFPGTLNSELDSKDETLHSRWHFGGSIGGPPINFGDHGSGSDENSPPSIASAPQLSIGSNSDSASSPSQAAIVPCGCLASMYLSLASLQQLPSEIVAALKTVRGACQVAATSIWCPQCGSVAVDNPNPPIETFQNTMLLGTILPIIANAYQRVLKMIDDETDFAEANGQTKTFRFLDYGGLCGHQSTVQEALTCVAKEMFFNAVEMPPHQWRTTVRALLRVDIYGHEQGGFKHKGLKDLVTEMQIRQRARHDLLDAHVAAGGTLGHGLFGQNCNNGGITNGSAGSMHAGAMHTCLQILNIAKLAIDNLVIA